MSHAETLFGNFSQTGARMPENAAESLEASEDIWEQLWQESCYSPELSALNDCRMPLTTCFVLNTLPRVYSENTTVSMLRIIEGLFGDSETDLARMLRVSRQMVYNYRKGMEPSTANRRRLQTLAELARNCESSARQPLRGALKVEQPSGKALIDYLSAEVLDLNAIRPMLADSVKIADQAMRGRLANSLTSEETVVARADITRARHAEGRPIYVGDPDAPGKLIQIRPDGSRIRGRMVRRQFVPDGDD